MIRQTMEWSTPCGELQCSQCRSRRSAEWREQVLAMAAAVTFLASGIGVILPTLASGQEEERHVELEEKNRNISISNKIICNK